MSIEQIDRDELQTISASVGQHHGALARAVLDIDQRLTALERPAPVVKESPAPAPAKPTVDTDKPVKVAIVNGEQYLLQSDIPRAGWVKCPSREALIVALEDNWESNGGWYPDRAADAILALLGKEPTHD